MADWTRIEVEATVADYFGMLERDLRGQSYNKSEHRRRLLQKLAGRSEGAVERKHSNISAILVEFGYPYIAGYKPLPNYQRLLRDVISQRLEADGHIDDLALTQVTADAEVPSVEDILKVLVDPPKPVEPVREARDSSPRPRKINYLEMEARNRSLGEAGEEFVLRFEKARLVAASKEQLADRVQHVSKTEGDELGYDIRSFEINGAVRFIEVKTTAYGSLTPFYVTSNELAVSSEKGSAFHLYRAYNFRRQPQLFFKKGPIDAAFTILPAVYKASIS